MVVAEQFSRGLDASNKSILYYGYEDDTRFYNYLPLSRQIRHTLGVLNLRKTDGIN